MWLLYVIIVQHYWKDSERSLLCKQKLLHKSWKPMLEAAFCSLQKFCISVQHIRCIVLCPCTPPRCPSRIHNPYGACPTIQETQAWWRGKHGPWRNLVAASKRLLWETPVAQELAGSENHCWGALPSGSAISPITAFCAGSRTSSQEPARRQAPATNPRPWVRSGVLRSAPLLRLHTAAAAAARARALPSSCRAMTKSPMPGHRGPAAGSAALVQHPSAQSCSARWGPLIAGKLIAPVEQQRWRTWRCKYSCLRLISLFFLLLSKEEAKIKSLSPISPALIKWSTWAHALR